MIRVEYPSVSALPEGHPCRESSKYHARFVLSIAEAFGAAGCDLVERHQPIPGAFFAVAWPDGRRAGFLLDYADSTAPPAADGSIANWADAVVKLKWDSRQAAAYGLWTAATGLPIIPGGYIVGHDGPTVSIVQDREWFHANCRRLRSERAARPGYGRRLMTRGAFRGEQRFPVRDAFRRHYEPQRTEDWLPYRQHVESLVDCLAGLHLSAEGDSIDRKFVEFCGVGLPIIATPGILHYRFPGGIALLPGEHFLVATTPAEADQWLVRLENEPDLHERLSRGAALTYDLRFAPAALGRGILDQLREVAR